GSPTGQAEITIAPRTIATPTIKAGSAGASFRMTSEKIVATSGSAKQQIAGRATPQRAMPRYHRYSGVTVNASAFTAPIATLRCTTSLPARPPDVTTPAATSSANSG